MWLEIIRFEPDISFPTRKSPLHDTLPIISKGLVGTNCITEPVICVGPLTYKCCSNPKSVIVADVPTVP